MSANDPYPTLGSATTSNSSGTATTNGVSYNVYTFTNISTQNTYTVTYTASAATYCYLLAVGGGGSGGWYGGGGSNVNGSNGGSGIVIISIPTTIYNSSNIGGSGTRSISTNGSYTVISALSGTVTYTV